MKDRFDRVVGRTAAILSVCLIVLLVGTVAVLAWPRVSSALGFGGPRRESVYKAGDQIDAPRDWYSDAPHTVIIFARADCGACVNAKPFFKKLVERVQASSRARVVLGGVSREGRPDAEFARAIGIDPGDARTTLPNTLRLNSVPTIVVVSADGRIAGAWDNIGPDKQHATADATQQAISDGILELIK